MGPKIEPCGTPLANVCGDEYLFLCLIHCVLSLK